MLGKSPFTSAVSDLTTKFRMIQDFVVFLRDGLSFDYDIQAEDLELSLYKD